MGSKCFEASWKTLHDERAHTDAMISALRKSRNIFRSIESQQQVVFALTDLELHNQTSELSSKSIADLAAAIQNEHSMFKPVSGTNWELRFGHFVGYGATYYSYLYADVLADDIWKRYFEGDSLAAGAAESLRDKLIATRRIERSRKSD